MIVDVRRGVRIKLDRYLDRCEGDDDGLRKVVRWLAIRMGMI